MNSLFTNALRTVNYCSQLVGLFEFLHALILLCWFSASSLNFILRFSMYWVICIPNSIP